MSDTTIKIGDLCLLIYVIIISFAQHVFPAIPDWVLTWFIFGMPCAAWLAVSRVVPWVRERF
jgi:hypothetical protein